MNYGFLRTANPHWLEEAYSSADRRKELVRLGRERYKQFTWQRCAKETLAIYESLI